MDSPVYSTNKMPLSTLRSSGRPAAGMIRAAGNHR